ncbi:MAG: TIR domain-containing protein [Sphingomonas sp.]
MAGAREYWAFLSYSHRDRQSAEWLHRALEDYRVPKGMIGRSTPSGPVTRRLAPVFCDREELAAADDLSAEIRTALAASRFLIVLCSPAATRSRWIEAEIVTFKELHPDGRIFAAILDGEPFASEQPGREAEECFPPSLRQRFDAEGQPTGERNEPIAADLREGGDGKPLGLMKLVAGMLGVPLDEIVRREAQRRQKRLTLIAAVAIVGMLIMTGMATLAIQARNEARHQREQAEALVGFMLGDLRTRLEPVGRLDVLDAVGSRVLGYYQGQDSADLSDEALLQRARALTLIGEIANRRGDLDAALARYREALAGTQEALRRAPNDAQRIFDHAQNVFWVASIDHQRGGAREAEAGFRRYRALAGRLLAIDASRPEWRLEAIYADTNLGLVLYEGGSYAQAERAFGAVLAATEQLRASTPTNAEYLDMESNALAYLADAREQVGRLEEAIAIRERQVRLLDRAAARNASDVSITRPSVTSRRALSRLFASRGDIETGLRYLREAQSRAQGLRERDPANMEWLHSAASVETDLGELLLLANRRDEAGQAARSGCAGAQQLAARDASVQSWRRGLRDCLILRGQLAAAQGYPAEALALVRRAGSLNASRGAQLPTRDRGWSLARARLIEGDQQAALRNPDAARLAWQSGLVALSEQNPSLMQRVLRFILLRRLGRNEEAEGIARWLDEIGYRHPIYAVERQR